MKNQIPNIQEFKLNFLNNGEKAIWVENSNEKILKSRTIITDKHGKITSPILTKSEYNKSGNLYPLPYRGLVIQSITLKNSDSAVFIVSEIVKVCTKNNKVYTIERNRFKTSKSNAKEILEKGLH